MNKELVCGVGIYTKGKYKGSHKGVLTRENRIWRNMLSRCYSEKFLYKRPTYTGCTVSENFKNFQFFAEWCNNQIGFDKDGWQLDKDILTKGNKVYSEDLCVFVPQELNVLLLQSSKARGDYPIGVSFNGKYKAYFRVNSRGKYVGTYDTVQEAFDAYKNAKEGRVKEMAEKYRLIVDERVYYALVQWSVSIDD